MVLLNCLSVVIFHYVNLHQNIMFHTLNLYGKEGRKKGRLSFLIFRLPSLPFVYEQMPCPHPSECSLASPLHLLASSIAFIADYCTYDNLIMSLPTTLCDSWKPEHAFWASKNGPGTHLYTYVQ
jgi:hypothetical protein